MPTASTVIEHLSFGFRVKTTGFASDRKATVTLSDGVRSKVYTGVTLSLPGGDLDGTFQAPSPLAPSTNGKVSVKGETSQFVANSATFVVKAY